MRNILSYKYRLEWELRVSGGDYIAIDWGTSNRRVYSMRGDGSVLDSWRDDNGVTRMSPEDYPREFAAIRARNGKLPIIAAGMIGSSRGWREVPYCSVPANVADLAGECLACEEDILLVPGVCDRSGGGADVMRGEEVQVLGALRTEAIEGDALFCQPGTHNKWIETTGDRIASVATAMTGEIFDLLKSHSILSEMLTGAVKTGPAFEDGVERGAGAVDLMTALFQARAAALLGVREAEETASYVSGLLIGSDVGSRKNSPAREIILLASGDLAELYSAAIAQLGMKARHTDSSAAFVAGIHAIQEQLR
ncbi:2-dehydro-3-deoxygalactonokinase [Altererythrobacter sp.]|uniref:2-dehydro-3-deoxygalactonokinase n=1 Tax=Altererythrobacter sp. TaxID=1872480 RepID=UPI003D01FB97